jgi:transcriptional regulator with XRE-family HTH domain
MMQHRDRFVFSSELGQRLRQLREWAGLTQQELAVKMGIECRGAHHVVGRLERARLDHPTIGMVADYLRACRAGFDDIADIFKRYTDRPTVPECRDSAQVRKAVEVHLPEVRQVALNYDIKTTQARRSEGRAPEGPEKRAARVCRVAAEEAWRRRLHSFIVNTIDTNKLKVGGLAHETHLQKQAQKFWKKLDRLHGKLEE